MNIAGEDAANYRAVRLDSFEDINKGILIEADEVTGKVVYKDTPESQKTVVLGDHAIKILPIKR